MPAPRPALAVFGFLWAFAILYHQVAYGVATASAIDLALTVAALLTMGWPDSRRGLCLLGLLHLGAMLYWLPQVANHWFFGALVSTGLVMACGMDWWRGRRAGVPGDEARFLDAFAPAGRVSVLLVYGLSGFHKLNGDFFTPGVSCASVLTGKVALLLGVQDLVPDPGPIVIWLTVLVELGLPFLLLIPRLRLPGVAVAIGFHLVMSAAGYSRFSATCVALLTLFLPGTVFQRVLARGAAGRWQLTPGMGRAALAGGLLAMAVAGGPWTRWGFLLVQVGLSFVVLAAVVRAWRGALELPALLPPRPARAAARPALLVPVLLVLAASQPYLGLSTDRALGMYSNSRTEGGTSNHFLIPARWQVFPYQRDLVQILSTSSPWLGRLAEERLTIPFQELRARVTEELQWRETDFSLRYRRAGVDHDVPSARADAALDAPVPVLQRMFLRFRPVEISGPRACTV